MSNSINFVGRLGRDSERKQITNGQMLKFTVGESVGYGEKKTTNWWNCSLFGKQAEGSLMDYLVKGAQVFIVGEVSFSQGQDGKTYNNLRITHIELTGSRPNQQQNTAPQCGKGQNQGGYGNQQQANNQSSGGGQSNLDDDLPFSSIDYRLGW
jgi:single-strand DNA-binding protein